MSGNSTRSSRNSHNNTKGGNDQRRRVVRFALNKDGSVKTSVRFFSVTDDDDESWGIRQKLRTAYILNQPSLRSVLDIIETKLPCFRKEVSNPFGGVFYHLVDRKNYDRRVQTFTGIEQILRFLLRYGIPDVDQLEEAHRRILTKAVVFAYVPRKDYEYARKGKHGFRKSDAAVVADANIRPLLQACGFRWQHRTRILAPISCSHNGETATAFSSLAAVRVFVRQDPRCGAGARTLGNRVQSLALRIWAATAPDPTPTFDWNRYRPSRIPRIGALLESNRQLQRASMPQSSLVLKPILKQKNKYSSGSRMPLGEVNSLDVAAGKEANAKQDPQLRDDLPTKDKTHSRATTTMAKWDPYKSALWDDTTTKDAENSPKWILF